MADEFKIAAVGNLYLTEREEDRLEMAELIFQAKTQADLLILCGDITSRGLVGEARVLADLASTTALPIIAVLGNHDHHSDEVAEIGKVLRSAGVILFTDKYVEFGGRYFVGVKGFGGGFGAEMVSAFGEAAQKGFVDEAIAEVIALERQLQSLPAGAQAVAVLHYSPIVGTLRGEPLELYPFLGSARLEEGIDRFPVRLVLHAHAARGQAEGVTAHEIPVRNCSRQILLRERQPFALLTI
jgi:Icc-related predicted phosphoesterase